MYKNITWTKILAFVVCTSLFVFSCQKAEGPSVGDPIEKIFGPNNTGDTPKDGDTPSDEDTPKDSDTPSDEDTPKDSDTPSDEDTPKDGDTPSDEDVIKFTKGTYFALDFTAQWCVYCPQTARILGEEKKRYGDQYVLVSMYPNYGLDEFMKVEESDKYFDYYFDHSKKARGFPTVLHNTLGAENEYRLFYDIIDSPAALQKELRFKRTDRSLDITFKGILATGQEALVKDRSLQVLIWVIQDGIVAKQYSPQGYIYDYKHNHVFRGTLNGMWGEPYTIGESYHLTADVPAIVPSDQMKDCHLVVLIIDNNTKKVLDALEHKL